MDIWTLARKLYAAGYTHEQVRSVWSYAHQEQTLPEAGKRRRKRWQAEALEAVGVSPLEVTFGLGSPSDLGNYF